MRSLSAAFVAVFVPGLALAGATRPGYVDGCQSSDGRYTVTAASMKNPKGEDGWKYTWKDAKTGERHSGWLVGVPHGLDHFRVAYTHIFVPPGGETFAVWQSASWAPCNRKPPKIPDKKRPTEDFKSYRGFADRPKLRGCRSARNSPIPSGPRRSLIASNGPFSTAWQCETAGSPRPRTKKGKNPFSLSLYKG